MAFTEENLEAVFGVAVSRLDEGGPWAYSLSSYKVVSGKFLITLDVLPASGEFKFIAENGGIEFLRIVSDHQTDIDIEFDGANAFLTFSNKRICKTTIRIKPDFYFGQEFGEIF